MTFGLYNVHTVQLLQFVEKNTNLCLLGSGCDRDNMMRMGTRSGVGVGMGTVMVGMGTKWFTCHSLVCE